MVVDTVSERVGVPPPENDDDTENDRVAVPDTVTVEKHDERQDAHADLEGMLTVGSMDSVLVCVSRPDTVPEIDIDRLFV